MTQCFIISKCYYNTIDPMKYLIRFINDKEIKPSLQIFTDGSKIEMTTDDAFSEFHNGH